MTPFPNAFEDARREGVARLLDAWARAQRDNDAAALAALVDERAAPGFLGAEVAKARALAAFPLGDWAYEVGDGPETPVPEAVAARLDATDSWVPQVWLRYSVAGVDEVPTRRPVALVVARRGERWRLVSDTEVADPARPTWRGPWEFGPLVVESPQCAGGRSAVVAHPDQAALAAAVAADLPVAVDRVAAFWDGPWPGRAVVFVASTPAEFSALTGVRGREGLAALAIADDAPPGSAGVPTTVPGQRVVVDAPRLALLDGDLRATVVAHEVFHVAARADTADGAPLWMVEGVADYAGRRGTALTVATGAPTVASLVGRLGPPNALPRDRDFLAGGEAAVVAYELAWTVAVWVARVFGEDALLRAYRALASAPTPPEGVDGALRGALGLDTAGLVARWAPWLTAQV